MNPADGLPLAVDCPGANSRRTPQGNHLILLALLFAVMATARIAAPENLFQGDQEKQVGYVMDILHNGNWVTQYEVNGKIATKPPFYNWCAAILCRATHSTRPGVMKLPGLVAGAGLMALLYLLGRKLLDPQAAFWATVAAISSHHIMKLMWFARTDMLMTFTLYAAIALTVLVRAYWWRAAAIGAILGVSFLTKGPVGPALYAIWLLGWAIANGRMRDRRGWLQVLAGTAIAALIAGWWLWAVWDMPGFRNTVVEGELGSRFQASGQRAKPIWYYLPLIIGRIAPWSLLAIAGAKLGWAREREHWGRRIAWWAFVFLAFFSLLPAKRHDLLLPVYPPVMLLAGIGMRELLRRLSPRWLGRATRLAAVGLATVVAIMAVKIGGAPAGIFAAATVLAAVSAVALSRRGQQELGFLCLAAMLVFAVGLESWKSDEESTAYQHLHAALLPIMDEAQAGRVVVMDAHPLVSYLLGLHTHDAHLPDAAQEQILLLSGSPRAAADFAETAWTPIAEAQLSGKKDDGIDLYSYRLVPRQQEGTSTGVE